MGNANNTTSGGNGTTLTYNDFLDMDKDRAHRSIADNRTADANVFAVEVCSNNNILPSFT